MAPQGGGLMRGLGIAVLGGFLGSMLFSGIAHAAGGFGGTGFGMIELLLLAGLGYFLYRKFMRPAVASGPGSAMQYRNTESYAHYPANAPASEPPVETSGIDYRSLTMMDRSFDPERFLKSAQDIFFKVQSAWNKQDTATLSALCGRELMQTWEEELSGSVPAISRTGWRISRCVRANLRKHGRRAVKASSPVRLHANLLDYTIDEKTGGVVSGSDRDAIEFTEYWTFSRPVGQNPWKLSAVQQA